MDATQIAERHVIERYLANQLSDVEAEAFEAYVEAHPEVTRQIELVARMKSGLGVLHRRGELQSVLGTPPRSWIRHPAFLTGAAASVAVAAFLWFRSADESIPLLAPSLEQLRGGKNDSLRLGATISLVRARGTTHGGEIELPAAGVDASAVQITLVLGEAAPGAHYTVEFLRLEDGTLQSIARLDNMASTADGSLIVFVRGNTLSVGNYVIRLTTESETAPIEFTMRVKDAEAG